MLSTFIKQQIWFTLRLHFIFFVSLFFFFFGSDQIKGYVFSSGRVVTTVVDLGPPADWVKINVRETVSVFCILLLIFFPRSRFDSNFGYLLLVLTTFTLYMLRKIALRYMLWYLVFCVRRWALVESSSFYPSVYLCFVLIYIMNVNMGILAWSLFQWL